MRFKVSISTQYAITINHGHTNDIILSDREEQTNDAGLTNDMVHPQWHLMLLILSCQFLPHGPDFSGATPDQRWSNSDRERENYNMP